MLTTFILCGKYLFKFIYYRGQPIGMSCVQDSLIKRIKNPEIIPTTVIACRVKADLPRYPLNTWVQVGCPSRPHRHIAITLAVIVYINFKNCGIISCHLQFVFSCAFVLMPTELGCFVFVCLLLFFVGF